MSSGYLSPSYPPDSFRVRRKPVSNPNLRATAHADQRESNSLCCQHPVSCAPIVTAPIVYGPLWTATSQACKSRLAAATKDSRANFISDSSANACSKGIQRSSAFPHWSNQSSNRIKQACHHFATFPWTGLLPWTHYICRYINLLWCPLTTWTHLVVAEQRLDREDRDAIQVVPPSSR